MPDKALKRTVAILPSSPKDSFPNAAARLPRHAS